MAIILTHAVDPNLKLYIWPRGRLWVDGREAANTDFARHTAQISSMNLPAECSGIAQIILSLRLTRPSIPPIDKILRCDFAYNKHRGRVSFTRHSIPHAMPVALDPVLSPSEVTANPTTGNSPDFIKLSITWNQQCAFDLTSVTTLIRNRDASQTASFQVDLLPRPATSATTQTNEQTEQIGPFQSDRTTLERGDLVIRVRDWFNGLSAETRSALETARSVEEMPGRRMLELRGFTSTAAGAAYNIRLGYDRAVAVLDALITITGNHNLRNLVRTPGVGEGSRETDVRSEENDNPEWRRVDIIYSQMVVQPVACP